MHNWDKIQAEIEKFRNIIIDNKKITMNGVVGQRISMQRKMNECDSCLNCLDCCSSKDIIITTKDIERISKHLKLSIDDFIKTKLRKTETKYYFKNESCEFLSNNGCSIYNVRPTTCVIYPFLSDDPKNRVIRLREKCVLGRQILKDEINKTVVGV